MEVIHALGKSNKFELFGAASVPFENDPSCDLLANHSQVPWLGASDFRARFRQLLDDWRIDLVFPTVDSVVAEFARWTHPKARFVVSPAETAQLLLSKTQTYAALSPFVPVPALYHSDRHVSLPAYAKPDEGAGTRGHRLVVHEGDLALARSANLVVMEYLPGPEFTVDCVSDPSGNLLFSNPRMRTRTAGGIALSTHAVTDSLLTEYAHAIANRLTLCGPWFAQFKLDASGNPKLLEVNARVGGSMTLTRLEGVNIPAISAFAFMGYEVRIPRRIEGLLLNRVLHNIIRGPQFKAVIWDLDDTIIRKDGKPDPDAIGAVVDLRNRGITQFVLTKNPHAEELLASAHVPRVFTAIVVAQDKGEEIGRMLRRYDLEQGDCVLVNDSNIEKLAIEAAYPRLRVITPDALEVLGREKLR